jgi:hypothetical protein
VFTLVTLPIVSFSSVSYVLDTHQPRQIAGIATKIDARRPLPFVGVAAAPTDHRG